MAGVNTKSQTNSKNDRINWKVDKSTTTTETIYYKNNNNNGQGRKQRKQTTQQQTKQQTNNINLKWLGKNNTQ